MLSCVIPVQLFATSWTVARHAPLSMGFSRQEYWSGLLIPPPGDLPDPGTEASSPVSPALQTDYYYYYYYFPIEPPGSPKMLKKSSNSFRYCSLRNHWIPLEELLIPERQIKFVFFF